MDDHDRSRSPARTTTSPSTPTRSPSSGDVRTTHVNLNDGVCQGMRITRCRRSGQFSVQHHPEASPGPTMTAAICSPSSTSHGKVMSERTERAPGPACSIAHSDRSRSACMPRRDDIESILMIGSGPIVIGQACEFDYSGTQACRVLRGRGLPGRPRQLESGHDHDRPRLRRRDLRRADHPRCSPDHRAERPDAVLPTLGGQTALNLGDGAGRGRGARRARERELIGADADAIATAEDRGAVQGGHARDRPRRARSRHRPHDGARLARWSRDRPARHHPARPTSSVAAAPASRTRRRSSRRSRPTASPPARSPRS